MKNIFKRPTRNSILKLAQVVGQEKSLILSGELHSKYNLQQDKVRYLSDVGFSVFSQWEEDGMINWLINKLNIENKTFVEFGVEDYHESNTRFLLMSNHWSGLVIDGSQENIASIQGQEIAWKYDLQTTASFITTDNIVSLIDKAGLGKRIGLLSVDIDGNDFWILEKLELESDIIIVEYNDYFGELPVSIPYQADFTRSNAHSSHMYWGASLAAFQNLLEKRGYVFAGTNKAGTNAFFLHSDHKSHLPNLIKQPYAWPNKMREARTTDRTLSYKRYKEMGDVIYDMPLVNTENNTGLFVKDLFMDKEA